MVGYWKRVATYHRRYLVLYFLVGGAIYLFYYMKWQTPVSLLLGPLGLQAWSAGLTRASVRLLMGDWQGAWDFNPLIYPLVLLALVQVFLAPLLEQ